MTIHGVVHGLVHGLDFWIYFDTPTFDRITKDRAAKFVDMLSAIGGTMGLLTGFSIISAAEILYFAAKIIWNLRKKKNIMIK